MNYIVVFFQLYFIVNLMSGISVYFHFAFVPTNERNEARRHGSEPPRHMLSSLSICCEILGAPVVMACEISF